MAELMGRFGYWQGVKQPAFMVTLEVPHRSGVSFISLDNWLVDVLAIELQEDPQPDPINIPNTAVASWAWRILQVAAYCQREARIPVFEPGRIMGMSASPNRPDSWQVTALIPSTDLLDRRAIFIAYGQATRIIGLAVDSDYDQKNISSLTEQIEKSAILPLRALARSGISTLPILKEALLQDIPYRHLGAGIYQLGWAANSRMINRSIEDTDSWIGSYVAMSKHLTAQLLRSAGLPAPVHSLVGSEAEAINAAQQLGWPLVVKPADRERSEGVTTAIHDEVRLLQGYKLAAKHSKLILVEREAPGDCYRLMVANGDFLYAVRRRPKAVVGDGQATIALLIERAHAKNERLPPWHRAKPIALDALCAEALEAQRRKFDDVPAPGERIALRLIESTEWGGDVEEATAEVHPENINIAVRTARLLRLSNAGIDIITPDVSKPWHENGTIINEVNFAPHFGGTSAARGKMPIFLRQLMMGDGRIPVETYIGGSEAMEAGRARQLAMLDGGIRCYLTSHELSIDGRGVNMAITGNSLFGRTLALLMNSDVGALVMVIQTDELLKAGLPIDRISRVKVCNGGLSTHRANGETSDRASKTDLISLLQARTTITNGN